MFFINKPSLIKVFMVLILLDIPLVQANSPQTVTLTYTKTIPEVCAFVAGGTINANFGVADSEDSSATSFSVKSNTGTTKFMVTASNYKRALGSNSRPLTDANFDIKVNEGAFQDLSSVKGKTEYLSTDGDFSVKLKTDLTNDRIKKGVQTVELTIEPRC
ncbi:hypothetical protein A3K86_19660 [Photobacterium jeanii]|uniref:Uncharacterized protein n=1 Tax=Photobacterium jeanii TaxID=858640 RepID=A0A178K1J7_9GAMM|nr:hypothetical protein [Photobacterium jeanii]OAN11180.1 hypothetical protein A3K86_19660 [Photobacterium jeanii]PST90699.1 hypothetical protein C9I91_08760 [Photobacterium jeanii]